MKFLSSCSRTGTLSLFFFFAFLVFLISVSIHLTEAQSLGGFAYNSNPIDYKASNFYCNPGDIQTSGTYAGRYNTYWYSFAEAYSNNSVPGNWCQAYSTDKVMAKSGSYLGADGVDHFQIRYNDHKNAAMKHDKIAVFYKNTLTGYGDYYMTGESYGSGLDPNGSGLYGNQVVHCPSGASVSVHPTLDAKYGATPSPAHLNMPGGSGLGNGLYDGAGHYWCELNGVAVQPLPGPEEGKIMPDTAVDKLILYKFTFPDANGNPLDFYKAASLTGTFPSGLDSHTRLKCEYGVAGPFIEGVNQHYVSPYESDNNKNKVTTPHYHCLGQAPGTFTQPVAATQTLPGIYEGTWWSAGYCLPGSTTCGAAGTKGKITNYCAKGTYWCQTKDAMYRTCSSNPTCTAADFEAPPPSWTLSGPTNLTLVNKPAAGYQVGQEIQFQGTLAATGTDIPTYGTADVTVEVSKSNTFTTVDWTKAEFPSISLGMGTLLTVTYPSGTTTLSAGTYYFRMKVKFNAQESPWSTSPLTFSIVTSTATPSTVTLTQLFPGQYSNTKFSINLADQDGLREFSLKLSDNSFIYSGSPGASGNVTRCDGNAMVKTLTSPTVTIEAAKFPVSGSATDCKGNVTNVTIQNPNPTTVTNTPSTITLTQLFPGQYSNTKFSINVIDPEGVKEFSIKLSDASSIYGGSPGATGNVGVCGGSNEYKTLNSSTVTIESSKFPLSGTVTDCKGIVTTVTAQNPNGATDTPSTITLTQLFPGQYSNTKFSINVIDPEGVKEFSIKLSDASSIYGGSPGATGNVGVCGGSNEYKTLNSSTVTIESSKFPLSGTVTDCKGIVTTVTAQNPNGATDTPSTITLTQLFPGQYSNTKFSINVIDPEGVKEFSIKLSDNTGIYGGSPGATGNVGVCGGSNEYKTLNSGTVTIESSKFPLSGTVTDCKGIVTTVTAQNPNAPINIMGTCTGFTLTITDNKSTYTKGDNVNYTYKCTSGKLNTITIQVVKPDGNAVTYNSGSNIDTASLGFSTSNLDAGTYTLRACFDINCAIPVTTSFTITASTTGTPIACSNGARCPKGSWCNNGQKFYYSNSEITCVAWSTNGTMIQTPPDALDCDPSETNCVNNGQIVPYSSTDSPQKWCGRGNRYFSKDFKQMTCVLWGLEGPAGFTPCSSNEPKCVAPGDYKTISSADTSGGGMPWCGGNAQPFYSKTQMYCAPRKPATSGVATGMMSGTEIKDVLAKLGTGWGLCNPYMNPLPVYSSSSSPTAYTPAPGQCLEPGQIGSSYDWCAWWPPSTSVIPGMPASNGSASKRCPNLDGTLPDIGGNNCPVVPEPTTCPKGQTFVTRGTSPCFYKVCEDVKDDVKTSGQCFEGEKCAQPAYCMNGRQCYNTDGTFLCSSWNTACPVGTKLCSPNDTKCIEPGQSGTLDGSCRDSMDCYGKDEKGKDIKFCQPMNYGSANMTPASGVATTMYMKPVSCPSGFKSCSPEESRSGKCLDVGETGKAGVLDSYCRGAAMMCYTDKPPKEAQIYCAPMPEIPPGVDMKYGGYNFSCPAGYKECRPGDQYCIEIGSTGPSSGYCAPGGKSCLQTNEKTGTEEVLCVEMQDSCPSNSRVCRKDQTGCIEPGQEGEATVGSYQAYCGGSAVSCYYKQGAKKGKVYCAPMSSTYTDPTAWEKVECPADSGRCRLGDNNCLEFGETRDLPDKGYVSYWCATGMQKYGERVDEKGKKWKTISCVSGKDISGPFPEKPPEDIDFPVICPTVIAVAYDPATNICKTFSMACTVPKDWVILDGLSKACKDGIVVDIKDDGGQIDLRVILDAKYQYLKDLFFQVKKLPGSVAEAKATGTLIEEAVKTLKGFYKKLPPKTKADREALAKDFDSFVQTKLKDIDTRMAALKPGFDFYLLSEDLRREMPSYEAELSANAFDPEYADQLEPLIEKLKSLLKAGETQTGESLKQITSSLVDAKNALQELIMAHRGVASESFLQETINRLLEIRPVYKKLIEEKGIADPKVLTAFTKFETLTDLLEDSEAQNGGLSRIVDQALALKTTRLDPVFAPFITFENVTSPTTETLLAHVDQKISEQVDKIFENVQNKMAVLLDQGLQDMAVKVAELTQRLEEVQKATEQLSQQISQSIANLTVIAEQHREIIVEAKNIILDRVNELQEVTEAVTLSRRSEEALDQSFEVAAKVNWCGDYSQKVQAKLNSAKLALEVDALTEEEILFMNKEFNTYVDENNEECFDIGATPFRDAASHEWYFAPIVFNKNNNLVRGYSDSEGNLTGNFGPGDRTLRIEALAMVMRILEVPLGASDELSVDMSEVPEWGIPYVNGAVQAGFALKKYPMNLPITRAEVAVLFREFAKAYLPSENTLDSAPEYKDYAEFKSDPEAVNAFDLLTDNGVFQGSGGYIHSKDDLNRAEFSTINQRLAEFIKPDLLK